MSRIPQDIKARLSLVSTSEGGRQGPILQGPYPYSAQFFYNDHDWDVRVELIDAERVYPGESAEAYLGFLSPHCHVGKIEAEMTFEIREGGRTVATGQVLEVIELEASAQRLIERDPEALERCRDA